MIAELKPDFRSVSLSLELIAAARNFLETPNSPFRVCVRVCVRFFINSVGQRCSTRLQLVGGSAQNTYKEESPNGFVLWRW